MTTEKFKVCKDCYPTPETRLAASRTGRALVGDVIVRRRPAPNPGPRCYSHWKARQKEVRAANHEKRVQDTYGLEKGEYGQLYTFQGGLCALCRRATGQSRRLSVDHDHATGDVRGLLCRPCNSLLGHARDKVEFFRRCIAYLNVPPYARMREGWTWDE